MKKLNKKGFTIVELVIVIAVIGILAAVLIPTFSGIIDKANKSATQQAATNLYKEVMAVDLADGTQDGKDDGEDITITGAQDFEYSVDKDNKITFKTGDDNYTAEFDGKDWTLTKGKYEKNSSGNSNEE